MSGKIFTCENCGWTGPSEWTEEEAETEYAELFGEHMGEERGVLCDDCDKLFKAWLAENKKDISN